MNDSERGFVTPLLVVIAILLIGATAYVALNKNGVQDSLALKTGNVPSTASVIASSSTASSQVLKGSEIYIFADDATYNALSSKIDRLSSDIKSDLGVKVIVQHKNYSNPTELRNVLKQSHSKNLLLGSILIGNIPTFTRSDGLYTDWFYQSLTDTCPVSSDGTFKDSAVCNALTAVSRRQIFTGRITPPINATNGIALIEKYLDKDHDYRLGKITFPKRMLLYPSAIINQINEGQSINKNDIDTNITSSIASQSRYSRQDVDVITDKDYTDSKNNYLKKLSQNRYETAIINIHGSIDSQFITHATGNVEVHADDIKNANPNILFINLLSCNNGAFKAPDYMAGWFLFSGDTLLVTAQSREAFIGGFLDDPPIQPVFFIPLSFLSSSVSLGNMFIHDSSLFITQTLGDPTLKIRGNSSEPQIQVTGRVTDFGSVTQPRTKTVSLLNTSNKTVKILVLPDWSFTIDSKTPVSINQSKLITVIKEQNFMGFIAGGNNPYQTITIQPKQELNLSVQFSPAIYESNSVSVKGKYFDIFSLLTSDPTQPFIDLTLQAQQN